ncbi:MAG: HypC/HybG/HupF family hydrogenase formation chaperone [Actinobacteria bacterium]|nr:HypC/HybG/HupF family hydrogenase formation chaperone [Actinomycetota bacterium]
MCLGMPGQVVAIVDADNSIVEVDIAGSRKRVSTAVLVDNDPRPVEVGDWVDVHLGFALARISEEQARDVLAFLEQFDQEDVPDPATLSPPA